MVTSVKAFAESRRRKREPAHATQPSKSQPPHGVEKPLKMEAGLAPYFANRL